MSSIRRNKLKCTGFVIKYISLMDVNGKFHDLVNYTVENSYFYTALVLPEEVDKSILLLLLYEQSSNFSDTQNQKTKLKLWLSNTTLMQ